MKIAHASSGAGSQIHHLNSCSCGVANVSNLIHQMRQRDLRSQFIQRNCNFARVFCIGIRADWHKRCIVPSAQIIERLFICGEYAVFSAHFHGQIAQHQTIFQIESCDCRAAIFKRLIRCAVSSQFFCEMQRNIFRINIARQFACQCDANRFRHAQPNASANHDCRKIRRANSRAKTIQRAVSYRMTIRANNQASRNSASGFNDQLVADPFSNFPQ